MKNPRSNILLIYVFSIFGAMSASSAIAASLETRTSSDLALSSSSGDRVNITNITVPSGQWIATAKASAVNWGEADYVRCVLMVGGVVVDGATTMTGEAGGQPAVAEIVTHAKLSLIAPTNVSLACSHDRDIAGQKIDPGATLIVVSDAINVGKGDKGDKGTIIAICADATGWQTTNPMPGNCSCTPNAKLVTQSSGMSCTAAVDSSNGPSCHASGFISAGAPYSGACCTCEK